MLDTLLKILRDGGTHQVGDLARELDTTYELVEAMLEDLVHMGYLRQVRAECGEACGSCPLSGLCAAGEAGRMWALTAEADPADAPS
jgi:hypothetical protein